MGLSLALSNALSGLNVNTQAMAVLSQNIANANTAGYSRQIINQSAVSVDGQGSGVSLDTVTRKIDDYLAAAVKTQGSVVGQTGVLSDYNSRIQLLLGQPGSTNSIDSFVNNFFNSVQSLAQTPQDTTLQQTAVNNGVTLAGQVQSLAQGLQNLQLQSDQDISGVVTAVNNDLSNISQLNVSIVNNTMLGKSVADLQDQRDALVNDVSQYMPVNIYTRDNGAINLSTSGGVSLLDDSTYQLNYNPAVTADDFSNGSALSALTVQRLDQKGNPEGAPVSLISGGLPSQVTTPLTSGKLAGLVNVRDTLIPGIMTQLDNMAAGIRDQVNAINNSGSSFPGANSYTGTRAVGAQDYSQWSGSVRIAVLGADGQAIPSPYPNGEPGLAPLTLNLSTLNTGLGAGNPSVQGIIDQINQYYGTPQNKAEVGNLNNIQMVSNSASLPGSASQLSFDFNLSNLSATNSNFYVTGVTVQNSSGTDITSLTSNVPSVALDPVNTYVTTANSNTVTINTTGTNNGLINGEKIYLSTPGVASVDGIPGTDLGGFYTVSNVTGTSFQITVANAASTGTTTGVVGQTATPPYAGVAAGQTARTGTNGFITANLAGNTTSPYYTVTANVAVDDGTGNLVTSQISYQVPNGQSNLLNTQYSAQSVTGGGSLVSPTVRQPIAQAMLVDANGNELPKINGQYTTLQQGYLVIKATNSTSSIAIDSMNSVQQGQPNNSPAVPGTNQGFSQYFDLNNFFQSNQPTATGDTVANSALNMQVSKQLTQNPSLISLGQLVQTQSTTGAPVYTYERDVGDNSIIQKLAGLATASITFAAAGGLGQTSQSFSGYAGQIIGAASTNASSATTDSTNAQTLLTGYTQQVSSVSGVNLDTELANTVIYQNAYAASARVITVTNTLFDTLLQAFT